MSKTRFHSSIGIGDDVGVLARHSRRADERVDMAHLRDGGQGRALDVARVGNVDAVGPAACGADFRGRRFQTPRLYVPEA